MYMYNVFFYNYQGRHNKSQLYYSSTRELCCPPTVPADPDDMHIFKIK